VSSSSYRRRSKQCGDCCTLTAAYHGGQVLLVCMSLTEIWKKSLSVEFSD